MKIFQISTYDIRGGAARATYRLHQGLRQLGQDCRLLVKYKASTDKSVIQVKINNEAEVFAEELFLAAIQDHYLTGHRTNLSNTPFVLPYPGYDLSSLPIVQAADVINLHWVTHYLSPITLQRLFALGKPVVWTLHDQWAFTGGCHYTAGCNNYRQDCEACPQLADDIFDLPAAILKDKTELFHGANLTIVTPSQWLASCVQASKLFQGRRVEVIPNSVETETFQPIPKESAKTSLGLDAESIVLLFGASEIKEKRKGFEHLIAAVKHCLTVPWFRDFILSGKVKIIYFGLPDDNLQIKDVPLVTLGYLHTDEEIRLVYSAADLLILPSLEDNLPNIMLEAMSCGTPIVGFDTGGIPELIKNGVTGRLASPGNACQLGETILSLIDDPAQLEAMGKNCRRIIEQKYTLEMQAKQYLALYQDLLNKVDAPLESAMFEPITVGNPSERVTEQLVELDPILGPNFQTVYDSVLLETLKEFAPYLQLKWQESEADRAARLEIINELNRQLQEVEADRAARLEIINELSQRLQKADVDRAARLEIINELNRQLQEAEADRADRLEVIDQLQTNLMAQQEVIKSQEQIIQASLVRLLRRLRIV